MMRKRKKSRKLTAGLFLMLALLIFMPGKNAEAAKNPYKGGYANCTWTAWQKAYDTLGAALPGWGNAVNWYNNAKKAGYPVGTAAEPNSIAVWKSSNPCGHVAFVTKVSGSRIYIQEGGYSGGYHAGWANASGKRWPDDKKNTDTIVGYIYLKHTHKNVQTTTKATTTKDGQAAVVCSNCKAAVSKTVIPSIKTVSLSKCEVYTGKSICPKVTVKDRKGAVISASNYVVKYSDNRKVGKGKVTVTFSGKYSGTVTKSFDIVLKTPSITGLKAKFTGKAQINFQKVTGAFSYEIQFRKKGTSSWISRCTQSTSYTISGLSRLKNYEFRVRSYCKPSYYSAWSSIKTCKIGL